MDCISLINNNNLLSYFISEKSRLQIQWNLCVWINLSHLDFAGLLIIIYRYCTTSGLKDPYVLKGLSNKLVDYTGVPFSTAYLWLHCVHNLRIMMT